jgi:hypothetical protein
MPSNESITLAAKASVASSLHARSSAITVIVSAFRCIDQFDALISEAAASMDPRDRAELDSELARQDARLDTAILGPDAADTSVAAP